MSGDGLTDLVRIRNGEVCYWPNLGYGRFGAKVTMDDAPWFDHARSVRPAAHPPGRHRRLGHHGHHLPGPRPQCDIYSTIRQQLERAASRCPFPRGRQPVLDRGGRSAGQRHGLPGLVLAAAGQRPPAHALHRPDGRGKSRICWSGRATTWARRRASIMRRPPSSTWQTNRMERPGSPGCPSPCMWSSGWRPTTTSAATAL